MCEYCNTIYNSVKEIQDAQYNSIGNDEICNISDGIVDMGNRFDLVLPEVDGTHRAIAYIKYCPYCGTQLIHKGV